MKTLEDRFAELELTLEHDEETPYIDVMSCSFGAQTKKEYNRVAKLLENYRIDNDKFSINLSFDVSGFKYWMKNMKEDVQITIVVTLKTKDLSDADIVSILYNIDNTDEFIHDNVEEYQFNKQYN